MNSLADSTPTGYGPAAEPQETRPVAGSGASALTGLLGAVLYLSGALLPGSPPRPDAAAPQVVRFFVDKRGPLLTGFGLELVALAFLLWFLGGLRALVARSGRDGDRLATTMTSAWVVLVTIVATAMLPAMAIVWSGGSGARPDLVSLAYGMQTLGTYSASSSAAFVSIGAPCIALWRSRLLPRWLVLLGGVEMAVNVVELIGLWSTHGALAAGYVYGIGPLAWVLWVAAASVCMARNRPAEGAGPLAAAQQQTAGS